MSAPPSGSFYKNRTNETLIPFAEKVKLPPDFPQGNSTYFSEFKTIKTLKKFNHKGTRRKEESALTVFFVRLRTVGSRRLGGS
jgi:hypothetical protein